MNLEFITARSKKWVAVTATVTALSLAPQAQAAEPELVMRVGITSSPTSILGDSIR